MSHGAPGFDPTEDFLLDHEPIEESSPFPFACRPETSCFGECCSNLNLPLTPHDALRLRRALGMPSRAFIERHATVLTAPDTGFPLLRLKMGDDPAKTCPFRQESGGCGVYLERPTSCRAFPVGRASRAAPDGSGEVASRLFLIREPCCKGFEEVPEADRVQRLDDWLAGQGAPERFAANDRWTLLLERQRGQGHPAPAKLAPMLLLSLYQPDDFIRFAQSSGMLDRLGVDAERRTKLAAGGVEAEEEALELGVEWLNAALFKAPA